ncbi:MAG: hypothetical protein ACRDND_25390, partial [Streptosporangiaceae bacterium]
MSCAALARARRLAAWVGPGRVLTASGVLRPAEAAQACRDLGIELPGPRLRSALDVEELMRDWATAAAAGLLEIDGRRARAQDMGKGGSSAPAEPEAILGAWARAATTLLDLGEEPCAGCLMVLHELHMAAGPLTVEQLEDAVAAVLEPEEPESVPCPGCGEVHDPGDLLNLDDLLGDDDEEDAASHAADAVTGLLAFGAAHADDAAIWLTPLGTILAGSVFQGRAPSPDADVATVV